MLNPILYWLDGINKYGWLFIYAHFFSVSFKQDIYFQNKGYDILSLNKHPGYTTCRFQDNPYYL